MHGGPVFIRSHEKPQPRQVCEVQGETDEIF